MDKWLRISSLIIQLILIAACFTHVIIISVRYFEYPTSRKSAFKFAQISENYYVSFCFPHAEKPSKSNLAQSKYSNVTLDQFVSFFPWKKPLIDSCSLRMKQNDTFITFDSVSECSKQFTIEGYILLGRSCFRIKRLENHPFVYFELTTSPFNKRVHYYISISRFFSNASSIIPIVHRGKVPFAESLRASFIYPLPAANEMYRVGIIPFIYHRMPAPYDTRCVERQKEECLDDCIKGRFHNRKVIPTFSHISLPNSSIGSFVLKDISLENSDYKTCTIKCKAASCYEYYTVTTVTDASYASRPLVFALETFTQPITRVTYEAGFSLRDFIIQVTSVMGVWVGASVSHLTSLVRNWKDLLKLPKNKKHLVQQTVHLFKRMTALCRIRKVFFRKFPAVERPRLKEQSPVNLVHRVQKVYDLVFRLSVFLFFLSMVTTALRSYFLYETMVDHEKISNPVGPFPRIAICTYYENLIGVRNQDFDIETFDPGMREMDKKANLTFNQMLAAIIAPTKVLHSCLLRNEKTSLAESHSGPVCNKFFSVSIFTSDNMICYNIKKKESDTHSHDLMSFGKLPSHPGVIYSVKTNPKLTKDAAEQFIILHLSPNERPLSSKLCGVKIYFDYGTFTRTTLSFQRFLFHYLPRPYDTKCLDKKDYSQDECLNECRLKKGEVIKRLPYYALIDKPSNLTFLTYTDLADKEIARFWSKAEHYCQNIACPRIQCEHNYVNTIKSETRNRTHASHYIIHNPLLPFLDTKFVPRIKFTDLAYNLSCCFSFWLGISVLSLNPVLFYARKREERVEKMLEPKLRFIGHSLDSHITWCFKVLSRLKRVNIADLKSSLESKRSPRTTSFIWVAILFIGCSRHCYDSVSIYMKYPTLMNTRIELEKVFPRSRMALCADLKDLIKLENGQHPNERYTFKELDRLTPTFEQFVTNCGYRPKFARQFPNVSSLAKSQLIVDNTNVSECLQQFETSKIFYISYVCYVFKDRKENERSFGSFNHLNAKHYFAVNSSLKLKRINPMIQSFTASASSTWSSEVEIDPNRPDLWFLMTYDRLIQNTLPSPYDEGYYTSAAQLICQSTCLKEKFHSSNLIPCEWGSISVKSDAKLFHRSFNHSRLFSKERISEECKLFCERKRKKLHMDILFPRIVDSGTDSIKNNEWWVKSTSSPVFFMDFLAQYSMFGLILEVGSIFAIWFGVSIIGCNVFRPKQVDIFDRVQLLENKFKQSRFLHLQLIRRFSIKL